MGHLVDSNTFKEIIICGYCNGCGLRGQSVRTEQYTAAVKYITCEDCDGEGRIYKLTKVTHEKFSRGDYEMMKEEVING